MVEDDHYIANPSNAHIDTSTFEEYACKQLTASAINDAALESIYDFIISCTNKQPQEPADCQLICRYLSADKFLRFLHTRSIYFPSATQFSDARECRIPEDYEAAMSGVLQRLGFHADDWVNLVRRRAAAWKISCWTLLDDYFDDHLMWNAYAGGAHGVGITVRYGILRDSLAKSIEQFAVDGKLHSGSVSYKNLCILPFNKHAMFRNEKEARFAFRASKADGLPVSVGDILGSFGIRISPDATMEHRDMIRDLWLKYGGEDRLQWPE